MKISAYLIQQITPYITGDANPPRRTGPELIALFNKYGGRDIYDELGLPDIGKKNGQRPSRKEYVEARLNDLLNKPELRELLNQIIGDLVKNEYTLAGLNKIFNAEGYNITKSAGQYSIEGGIIDKRKPVINEAYFQDIQSKILRALDGAQVSIRVAMAWFTNETLFAKLVEKSNMGVDVQVAIYDDGVNKKHGVDIALLPHKMIKKGTRGGLMHDKFCVIDNQTVITGSYNWTDNAEFRNDENISVQYDPEQATRYSVEYRRLTT